MRIGAVPSLNFDEVTPLRAVLRPSGHRQTDTGIVETAALLAKAQALSTVAAQRTSRRPFKRRAAPVRRPPGVRKRAAYARPARGAHRAPRSPPARPRASPPPSAVAVGCVKSERRWPDIGAPPVSRAPPPPDQIRRGLQTPGSACVRAAKVGSFSTTPSGGSTSSTPRCATSPWATIAWSRFAPRGRLRGQPCLGGRSEGGGRGRERFKVQGEGRSPPTLWGSQASVSVARCVASIDIIPLILFHRARKGRAVGRTVVSREGCGANVGAAEWSIGGVAGAAKPTSPTASPNSLSHRASLSWYCMVRASATASEGIDRK